MDKKEIERLFRQYYTKMFRVARTILYDEQESKDVVSGIFEYLLYNPYLLTTETEESYLMTSVRNRCLKHLRHENVKRQAKDRLFAIRLEFDETEEDKLKDLSELASQLLSPQEQRIFHLRFALGYSYKEIAQHEGISRVAVWKHLSHLLHTIKNKKA